MISELLLISALHGFLPRVCFDDFLVKDSVLGSLLLCRALSDSVRILLSALLVLPDFRVPRIIVIVLLIFRRVLAPASKLIRNLEAQSSSGQVLQ